MQEITTPLNRLANLAEMERAHHALLSFSGFSDAVNSMLALNITMAKKGIPPEDTEMHPLVVRDFSSAINSRADILLVPAGVYEVPAEFLKKTQCHIIIGLPWDRSDYPTLVVEGLPWKESMAYVEDEPKTPPRVCDISDRMFANVRLDARQPTVLEMSDPFLNGFLTNRLQHVVYGQNIEILDWASDTVCLGRDWARAAYGPKFGVRGVGVKALEGTYMGLLSGVDAVFRPLVALGEQLEKRFGLT